MSYQSSFGGGLSDGFVAKLDANGILVYSTFLGGSGPDSPLGIAHLASPPDPIGHVYVAGGTNSNNFPTTPGSLQTSFGGQGSEGCGDAFITKLIPSFSVQQSDQLVYSTYLGGSGDECWASISVDSSGNSYLNGATASPPSLPPANFRPVNAYQDHLNGMEDAFVAKLIPDVSIQPSSNQLVYFTYLGGSGHDMGRGGIALDSARNI
jgi:hypothetical protein